MELQSTSADELKTETQETILHLEETIHARTDRDTINLLTNRYLLKRIKKPKKCLVQVSFHKHCNCIDTWRQVAN